MSVTLITGASGFVGRGFASALKGSREIVCLSRKDPKLDAPWVRGSFNCFEDLRQLDRYAIDAVVHFAAVTGGCFERDGVEINAEGTRRLMRYAIDRGCRRFVLASSIALVGTESIHFRPQQLPIPDEHPCLDRHGYGFSKYLMEEVTRYLARQNPDISVINLRLSGVFPDAAPYPPARVEPPQPWGLNRFCMLCLTDAVAAFRLALAAPLVPGVRVYNVGPARAFAQDPVATILRNWWGPQVDLTYHEEPGHEFAQVWDVSRLHQELGFRAEKTLELMDRKLGAGAAISV